MNRDAQKKKERKDFVNKEEKTKYLRKLFRHYVDEWDMVGNQIVTTGEIEVGDSSQRMGMIYLYENLTGNQILDYRNDEVLAFDLLTPPRRHRDQSRWPGQRGTLSRDNAQPMICANEFYARKIGLMLLKRFGLFWNYKDLEGKKKKLPIVDLAGPATWGAIIRSGGLWWLYPLLWISDLWLLLQTISVIFFYKVRENHTTDLLNTECLTLQARHKWPTLGSWIARYIFQRPEMKVMEGLRHYFRPRPEKDMLPPPIHYLYIDFRPKEHTFENDHQ